MVPIHLKVQMHVIKSSKNLERTERQWSGAKQRYVSALFHSNTKSICCILKFLQTMQRSNYVVTRDDLSVRDAMSFVDPLLYIPPW